MKTTALILLAFFVCTSAERCLATTYYVSPVGDDSAAGTSPSVAWRTIAHVNAFPFSSGDEVLFQAGGTWREMLQPNGANLTFSSYGAGSRPIVSGASLVTTAWTAYSGNVCQSAVGGWDMTGVWTNHVLGRQATFVSGISAPGDWYWSNGMLYLDLANGCGAGVTLPTIEVTSFPEALYLANVGNITVEHLGFVNGMYTSIYLDTGLTGTQTFDDVLWSGGAYTGFYANSGSLIVANSEGLYSSTGLAVGGGSGFSLTNSILSGNSTDAIEIWSTAGPSSIQSSTISGNATTNPLAPTMNNWSTFPLTVGNSVILANPFIPVDYSFYNITDLGNNIEESPMFTSRAAPAIIVPFVDDYYNLNVIEQVAPVAASYGCPMSYSLNTKLVTPADWVAIQALQASGVEIVAHGRSHSDLTNNNVFSISYAGAASTATMTLSQAAGTLQTFLNGSTTPDLTVPIGQQWNDAQTMCAAIAANRDYRCTLQPNQMFFTPLLLADVASANIKPSYMLAAASNYLNWEVEGSQADIDANIPGYTVTDFATPFASSNATVEAHVQSAGFLGQRNGIVDASLNPNGNWSLSSFDIYNLAGYAITGSYVPAQPAGWVGALVEGLGAQGGVIAVYAHTFDEFSLANWTQFFELLHSVGATCMTMSQARDYIETHGTLAQDGANRRWVESVLLQPVFSNTSSSPVQGAHGLQ